MTTEASIWTSICRIPLQRNGTIEIAFLRKNKLRPGCRVFDIGAHQCVIALMLAKIAGPSGFVLAVEANKHNAWAGEKNREINDLPQLRVLHAAIAAKKGKVIMSELLNSAVDDGTSGLGGVEVSSLSIDDLTRAYGVPDVLYIDVEGFELEALKGAEATIKARPDCFVEVHTRGGLEAYGGSVDSVASFFASGDYRLYMASGDKQEFVPFDRNNPITKERFFLIATARTAEEEGGLCEEVKVRP